MEPRLLGDLGSTQGCACFRPDGSLLLLPHLSPWLLVSIRLSFITSSPTQSVHFDPDIIAIDFGPGMVSTLDYAFFPHLFSLVVGHCDFKTQLRLRLLSSIAKLEVDKQLCRQIHVYIFPTEYEEDHPPDLESPQCLPEEASFSITIEVGEARLRAPILWSAGSSPEMEVSDMTTAIRPAFIFALRNAHIVTTRSECLLWDHTSATNAAQGGTSYHSPFEVLNPSHMNLYVDEFLWLGGEFMGPNPVPLPASVRHLFVHFCDCGPAADSWLAHKCTTVTVRLELCYPLKEEDACTLMRELITPCVRDFLVVVDGMNDAVAYLNVLKKTDRHSLLAITVETTSKVDPYDPDELQARLNEAAQTVVVVRPHSG